MICYKVTHEYIKSVYTMKIKIGDGAVVMVIVVEVIEVVLNEVLMIEVVVVVVDERVIEEWVSRVNEFGCQECKHFIGLKCDTRK